MIECSSDLAAGRALAAAELSCIGKHAYTLAAQITISSSLASGICCPLSIEAAENAFKDSLCHEALVVAGPSTLSTKRDVFLATKQVFLSYNDGDSNQLWMPCTENDVSSVARPLTFPKSVAEGSDDEGWDDESEKS